MKGINSTEGLELLNVLITSRYKRVGKVYTLPGLVEG